MLAGAPNPSLCVRSYHAHIYFLSPEERERALGLREWIGERFPVELGRVHDAPIGPHDAPMYQVAFNSELFAVFVPWLMLNRQQLRVLVHPNTGRDLDDHTVHPLWLGEPLPVRSAMLRNDPPSDVGTRIVTNTQPRLSPE